MSQSHIQQIVFSQFSFAYPLSRKLVSFGTFCKQLNEPVRGRQTANNKVKTNSTLNPRRSENCLPPEIHSATASAPKIKGGSMVQSNQPQVSKQLQANCVEMKFSTFRFLILILVSLPFY